MAITLENKIHAKQLYENGMTLKGIQDSYGYSRITIANYLNKNNIKIRKANGCIIKYPINKESFKQINNEESAYFLGLMYADGYVLSNKTTFGISLQEEDCYILEKFLKFLDSKRPFYTKTPEIGKVQKSIIVNSSVISNNLINLGCFPRKSLILKFPTEEQVPKHLIHHFIRGYFDGDGCITAGQKFSFSMLGTTDMMQNIVDILSKEIKIDSHIVRLAKKNCRVYMFSYSARKDILKIYDWLYKDATIYLERKKKKFETLSLIKDVIYNNQKLCSINNCENFRLCSDVCAYHYHKEIRDKRKLSLV